MEQLILVGEVEFTDARLHPDGYNSFLFVGAYQSEKEEQRYIYSMATAPYPQAWKGGEVYNITEALSVTDFIKKYMEDQIDISHGRTAGGARLIFKFKELKGRLKGMTEWIEVLIPKPEENA